MEFFAWVGAILLGGCAIPQAWQSYRDGHSRGLNWGFVGSWFFGEAAMIVYVLPMGDAALTFNYGLNFGLLLVILRYKIWERKVGKTPIAFTPRML